MDNTWWGISEYHRISESSMGYFGVQCLAQEYFDIYPRGIKSRPDVLYILSHSWSE